MGQLYVVPGTDPRCTAWAEAIPGEIRVIMVDWNTTATVALVSAFRRVCASSRRLAQTWPEGILARLHSEMGSGAFGDSLAASAAAAVVSQRRLDLTHIGDVRVAATVESGWWQGFDHTLASEAQAAGIELDLSLPTNGVITRALGPAGSFEPESTVLRVRDPGALLMCTRYVHRGERLDPEKTAAWAREAGTVTEPGALLGAAGLLFAVG